MRFHQFKQHLKTIGSFSNSLMKIGSIDLQELKKCLENLQLLNLKELEVEVGGFSSMSSLSSSASSIFRHSHHLLPLQTIDNYGPMQTSKMGSSELEATFDTIVEVFLLHDKIGDGKFNKKDLVNTLNDAPSQNSEMDRYRNGKVSFREFLFALIQWVGIDAANDEQDQRFP